MKVISSDVTIGWRVCWSLGATARPGPGLTLPTGSTSLRCLTPVWRHHPWPGRGSPTSPPCLMGADITTPSQPLLCCTLKNIYKYLSKTFFRPVIIGGWRNKALDNMLLLDECEEDDDLTRMGVWSDHDAKLKIGREKFASISVPRSFLVGTDLCYDN